MMSLLKAIAKDEEACPTLFKNTLARAIAIRRRFPVPRIIEETSWIATDATPSIIGVVDRRDRNYIRVDAGETTKGYVESDGFQAGIADKELTGLVLGGVAGFAARPGAVRFIGVDNSNAVAWVVRGESRCKFARKLLITFLLWRVYLGIEVVIFCLRTNHNVAADEVTRLEDNDLADWDHYKGLRRVGLPSSWGNSIIPYRIWTGGDAANRPNRWS